LPIGAVRERLWLMPTTGTKLYRCVNGAWRAIYAELFDDRSRLRPEIAAVAMAGDRQMIPTCIDHDPRAHLRRPIVMMRHG
jgi:hypothetical protein